MGCTGHCMHLCTINCLVFVITQYCGPHVSCFSAIAGSNTADNVLLHFGENFAAIARLVLLFSFQSLFQREELEDNFLPLDSEFSLHFPMNQVVWNLRMGYPLWDFPQILNPSTPAT